MTTAQLIGADPGWLIAVKALLVFVVCVLLTLMSVWGSVASLDVCSNAQDQTA